MTEIRKYFLDAWDSILFGKTEEGFVDENLNNFLL